MAAAPTASAIDTTTLVLIGVIGYLVLRDPRPSQPHPGYVYPQPQPDNQAPPADAHWTTHVAYSVGQLKDVIGVAVSNLAAGRAPSNQQVPTAATAEAAASAGNPGGFSMPVMRTDHAPPGPGESYGDAWARALGAP